MAQYSFERLEPEYTKLWAGMHVVKSSAAIAEARWVIQHKDRFQAQEKLTKVPWFVSGCLTLREAIRARAFESWAHNGDPMRNSAGRPIRTTHVTANRPPNPDCSWEDGCYDAYIVCDTLGLIDHWSVAHVAYAAEKFNGFGYRNPKISIPSPYLWGGTSVQKRGKFVADRKFDTNTMDPQIGVMAILWAVMELDPEARFAEPPPVAAPPPADQPDESEAEPPPQSPKAHDTETAQQGRLPKSRTIWGTVVTMFSSLGGVVTGFFDKLDNPYYFAIFMVILLTLIVGGFMIVTGRINVQKLVEHLAEDDTQKE